jgi:hypothetical protein
MTKFAHVSDAHLGGWKQEPLQELNFQSFKKIVDICIKEKVDFILIAGDLFDSAYPPIEVLKRAFGEFRRLKEAKIPCFIIAGSHDYSVSGKTFLDVIEEAGFCKNVTNFEEINNKIVISPIIHQDVAIYGYPGKKSGLEIEDLRRIRINDSPGMFRIFMLHTTLDKAKGDLPVDAIEMDLLPKMDYYAMGHLHIDFQYQNFVYPGPVFPNNFQELEDLHSGGFYIVNTSSPDSLKKFDVSLKEVISVNVEIKNAFTATEKIISEIDRREIKDKIVLLRVRGELENGENSDIKFSQIEDFVKKKGAYFLLKNTHELSTLEPELISEIEAEQVDKIEDETIKLYSEQNLSEFNKLILPLMHALSIEKQEGEKSEVFTNRLLDETKKILGF